MILETSERLRGLSGTVKWQGSSAHASCRPGASTTVELPLGLALGSRRRWFGPLKIGGYRRIRAEDQTMKKHPEHMMCNAAVVRSMQQQAVVPYRGEERPDDVQVSGVRPRSRCDMIVNLLHRLQPGPTAPLTECPDVFTPCPHLCWVFSRNAPTFASIFSPCQPHAWTIVTSASPTHGGRLRSRVVGFGTSSFQG